MTYLSLEHRIQAWAAEDPRVSAVVAYGSRARTEHEADAWSDLDLILFVEDPQVFVEQPDWLPGLGEIWMQVLKITAHGYPEWLVLFEGGLKVDFLFAFAGESALRALAGPPFSEVARRGIRLLVAKDPEGQELHLSEQDNWQRPSYAEFDAEVQSAWLAIYRTTVLLQRGELWRARSWMDGVLRTHLEQVLAWQARAKYGPGHDTWHDGRFLAEWADPEAVAALPKLFAGYDLGESKRALAAFMHLYAALTSETAVIWEYPLPIPALNKLREWLGVFWDSDDRFEI